MTGQPKDSLSTFNPVIEAPSPSSFCITFAASPCRGSVM
jgi:hypothetical protein